MLLRLSPRVPRDLEQIADYIAQDSPRHALRVLRLLRAKMREIARRPIGCGPKLGPTQGWPSPAST